MEADNVAEDVAPAVRKGRPPKAAIKEKKKRGQVGRPAGDAARIAEFKARLLSTSGSRVIDKVLQIAMDDNHSGQMAAIKMCVDRLLPVSMFDKEANGGHGSKPTITINIAGIGQSVDIQDSSDYIDGEVEEEE